MATKPLRRTLGALIVLGIAAKCPAPIHDSRTAGPVRLHSEAERNQEQALNGTQGVVGVVPQRTEAPVTVADAPAAPVAEAALRSASSEVQNAKAGEIVAEAAKRVDAKPGLPKWLLMALFALGAVGAFQGFRVWLDRAAPYKA